MHCLHRDYETRSTADLPKVGAQRYATHPDTDVRCLAFAVDDGPVQLWVPGDPCPPEWELAARDENYLVVAHNDAFERAIEQHIMGPRYGRPLVPIERHRCTMASALSLALPAKLETVALALALAEQKDADGRINMLACSKPRKPGKGEPPGLHWHDDPARLERLHRYCRQDVEVERALHHRIGFLSPAEQAVWELDATINARGVYIDSTLARAAVRIANVVHTEIDAEIAAITGGAVESINQVGRLLEWLNAQGCKLDDLGKGTLSRAKDDRSAIARRAIELRLDGAHASANKFRTMLAWRNPADGRVRGALMYHGASTGRWSSHGIQLQNLKRPMTDDLSAAIDAVATGDIEVLCAKYPQPMAVIGDITRATIASAPGHRLFAADYSGIEARVLAWLASDSGELAQWAKFDETKNPADEPYLITGQAMRLGRDQGKTATLTFGYMGGVGAFRRLAPNDPASDEEVKRRQQEWRRAHPAICKFWGDINRAAISAAQNRRRTYKVGARISFLWASDSDYLKMTLPRGRQLAYPFPSLFCDPRGELAVVFKDSQAGKWVDCRHGRGAYGGTWTENAVQAVSRDILVGALPRLEAAGYPIVLHVHDEVIAEVSEGFGSEEEFLTLVTEIPEWAAGLPIAAKFRAGERFCKIKPACSPGPAACSKSEEIQEVSNPFAGPGEPAAGPGGPEPREAHDPEPISPPEIDDTYEHHEHTVHGADDADNTREYDDSTADYTGKYNSDGYPSGEMKDPYGPHYIYRDKDGNFYSRATRKVEGGKKSFLQSRWENGRWVPKSPAIKIPYRLPELIAAAKSPVFICEGERDADSVAALGLIATTNPGGAIPKAWTRDLNHWFAGRAVYILEDNDATGRAHVERVAAALRDVADSIRIIEFRDLAEHGDVTDWLAAGGTRAELMRLAVEARSPHDGYVLVCAEDVLIKNIDWLWYGHLAANTLELIAGAPGAGKSQIQDCCVACITTGVNWPDGANGQGRRNVIMLTAEDTLDDTMVPRLIAAGADIKRVRFLKSIRKDERDRMFLLGEDLDALERAIRRVGDVGLVTIDPITAYMGKINSHMTTDVRAQLGPLKDFSERICVGISAITHPPKNAGPRALDQFIGSQAYIAAARLGHLCVEEFEQDLRGNRPTGRMLYTLAKHNPVKAGASLAYRIVDATGGIDYRTGRAVATSKISWEGPVDVTANEALAATAPKKDHSGAVTFLMDILANGPVPKTLIDERANLHGFSADQMRRAKDKMGIVPFKEQKFQGGWLWCLPQHHPKGLDD